MTASSDKTTGNVPVAAIDPGGTHKAPAPTAPKQDARPEVQSGDQNSDPTRVSGNKD